MSIPQPSAFDAFAHDYDDTFSSSRLARLLRPRVWNVLHSAFPAGSRILELACGTGVDAVCLARQGVRVTATDGSPQMVEVTRARVVAAGLDELVTAQCCSFQDLAQVEWPDPPPFDGAFSNFGGLNTLPDLTPLARSLAGALRPSAPLVLVPMGPFCPWELVWHLAHRDSETAWRRFRQPATAHVGTAAIPIWYPSPRHLRRALKPWFRHVSTHSLGLFLPPSYLSHLVERVPRLFSGLNRLEATVSRLTAGWGDHYISVFIRTSTPSNRSSMR